MLAALLCFGRGLVFAWAVVDLAGVVEALGGGSEDLGGVVVGFLGVVVCLFDVVDVGLVFLGGSLGIFFFFSSAIF